MSTYKHAFQYITLIGLCVFFGDFLILLFYYFFFLTIVVVVFATAHTIAHTILLFNVVILPRIICRLYLLDQSLLTMSLLFGILFFDIDSNNQTRNSCFVYSFLLLLLFAMDDDDNFVCCYDLQMLRCCDANKLEHNANVNFF